MTTQIEVAPSQQYSGTNNGPEGSNGAVYPIFINQTAGASGMQMIESAWINLEGTTVSWASTTGNGAWIGVLNWRDKVNAN